jgi:asparagine synthase (glutamine-hydrolysing)
MCAIFGVIGEFNNDLARLSLARLSHRGGDGCGIVEQDGLFFAHQMLSIRKKLPQDKQPFRYKNILLSFNGEIYNYKELKSQLESEFKFKTDSECEVIVFSYLKWGEDFVKYLRGMFAIAIKDGDTLYLFRDRLGKKPLFFMEGRCFVFASEIKAITPFLSKVEMSDDALLSYLSFLAPTPPHTFYKGIKKLSAGEYLKFEISSWHIQIKRYFDLLDTKPNLITSRDEAIYRLESLLEESISIRVDADVEVASLLSGGIDSATINAYALKNGVDLQTYTIGYDGYSKYDERKNAKKSAEFLGLKNKEIIITQDQFLDASEDVLTTLDEPLNDPASIPLYLLFKHIAKDGYKVVLSGEGSDELFLGYRQYFEYLDIERISSLKHKNWMKNYLKSNYSQNREWEHYKRAFSDTLLFRTSGESFSDLQKNRLMKRNIKDNQSLKYIKPYRDRFNNSLHEDESVWYSYIDLNLFQAEHFLTKLDRVSMAHTIESRTPFLDHILACEIFSISPKLRYEDKITKSILKQIVKPMLGDEIINRKKKGFSNPYMEYLLNTEKLSLIKEVNKQTGIFKTKELDELLASASKGGFKQHIWGLYALSHWIKKCLL